MLRGLSAAAAAIFSLCIVVPCSAGADPTLAQGQLAQARSTTIPEASAFIANLADRAIEGLADKALSPDERAKRFRTLLTSGFDIPQIARFVLGRYWRAATPEERDDYVRLFEDFIVQTYSSRFSEYGGENLQVGGTSSGQDGDVTVYSNLVRPSGAPIKVEWKLQRADQTFKVVDVVVEGVSMGVTQRDDFAATLQAHGGKVADLIQILRQKVQTASN